LGFIAFLYNTPIPVASSQKIVQSKEKRGFVHVLGVGGGIGRSGDLQ
jgi:hypothetical protein